MPSSEGMQRYGNYVTYAYLLHTLEKYSKFAENKQ